MNARQHSDAQVSQIAGSIRAFGFNAPVLVDGENGIIAGHGRVRAALILGLETVPCVRLTHLTEAQRRAYILADNRIALSSTWDEAMLALELTSLKIDDVDLGLTGFSAAEVDALVNAGDVGSESRSADQLIDVGEFSLAHTCPRCGFEFDKSAETVTHDDSDDE
jgi:ParB-like chromosome segregation protein Spo0J